MEVSHGMLLTSFLRKPAISVVTAVVVAVGPSAFAQDAKEKPDRVSDKINDLDQDFVAMMIPHHQGAIDLGRAEVRFRRETKAACPNDCE
jgi:uncharacterized protein (DUF305 family)